MFRRVNFRGSLAATGLLTGAFIGGVVFGQGRVGAGVGALLGLALFGFALEPAARRLEPFRFDLVLGTSGMMAGIIAGSNSLLGAGRAGAAAGFAGGLAWFGFVAAALVRSHRARNLYADYRGSAFVATALAFGGAWAGVELSNVLIELMPKPSPWWRWLMGISLPLIIATFLSILPGYVFALNRSRPAWGGLLSLGAGGLVLWVGISIAPLLFLPGSGLMWAGLVIGSCMAAAALLSLVIPRSHSVIGITLILLSILSFVGAAGGLVVGGLLGVIGGSLVFAWQGTPLEVERITPVLAHPVQPEIAAREAAVGKDGVN
ncbi:MAG: hypothetical protein IMX06_04010 [Kyrpidia tusciae]|nr:DUF6114 domain-containing protein [Kyrpidia tusciae]MBE3552015.1 hypothetical protein [Kyrpidia tusciae]